MFGGLKGVSAYELNGAEGFDDSFFTAIPSATPYRNSTDFSTFKGGDAGSTHEPPLRHSPKDPNSLLTNYDQWEKSSNKGKRDKSERISPMNASSYEPKNNFEHLKLQKERKSQSIDTYSKKHDPISTTSTKIPAPAPTPTPRSSKPKVSALPDKHTGHHSPKNDQKQKNIYPNLPQSSFDDKKPSKYPVNTLTQNWVNDPANFLPMKGASNEKSKKGPTPVQEHYVPFPAYDSSYPYIPPPDYDDKDEQPRAKYLPTPDY